MCQLTICIITSTEQEETQALFLVHCYKNKCGQKARLQLSNQQYHIQLDKRKRKGV